MTRVANQKESRDEFHEKPMTRCATPKKFSEEVYDKERIDAVHEKPIENAQVHTDKQGRTELSEHQEKHLKDMERIEMLETQCEEEMNREDLLQYHLVSLVAQNKMLKPSTKSEDLGICYPNRDFGQEKQLEYGTFFCGGYRPNGK